MLIGLYTKDGDLELGGSAQGLLSLAERLIRNRETQFDLALSTSGVDPTPYDGVLSRLSVKIRSEQPLYIGRTGTTLRIEGSQRTLETFASNLESLARQGSEQHPMGTARVHLHLDYYPGHYFLDESSEPIVIAVLWRDAPSTARPPLTSPRTARRLAEREMEEKFRRTERPFIYTVAGNGEFRLCPALANPGECRASIVVAKDVWRVAWLETFEGE